MEVEILRGKEYPQPEDEPNPCTTQVCISVVDRQSKDVLAEEQCSSLQEKSNSPFYKDSLTFSLDDQTLKEVILIIRVVEFSRRKDPYVLLSGELPVTLANFKIKKECPVELTQYISADGNNDVARISAERVSAASVKSSITLRIATKRNKVEATRSADVDVEVDLEEAKANSSTQMVPTQCEYIWLRLLTDKRWAEGFRYALSVAWRTRAPLGNSTQQKTAANTGQKKNTVTAPAADGDVRTLGDVILKKWCCCHVYQILTRLRLTAEKYATGDTALSFNSDEEIRHRREKKSRAIMVESMSLEVLGKTGNGNLRDWLERLWVAFAVGIDNDPAGARTLSYDSRKAVYDAPFGDDDAVILQACLLFFLVPTLPFEQCLQIAEDDIRISSAQPCKAAEGTKSSWDSRVTESQKRFTRSFVSFVGPLMDTLTESELLKIARVFKPAVLDAHTRIAKGGKAGISDRLQGTPSLPKEVADGIHIKHLDRLGNRRKSAKFV